jgi:hypothetical protein
VAAAPVLVSRPIHVVFRDPLGNKNDAAYRVAKRLRLEAGVMVPSTTGLSAREAAGDRAKYLLRATEAVEGGFDAVNIYDKGILSWGIMQWASHSNSLQNALWYMKNRLASKNRRALWTQLFKANGLDVQRGPGGSAAFFVGSNVSGQWRPIVGVDNLRVLFRGTRHEGRYDPATIARWARVFARAGQQPAIQQLQTEWATIRLETCLNESVDGLWKVRHYTNGDLFSDALYFTLWTNNPNACRTHFRQAIRQARIVSGAMDPKNWPPGLFPLLWEQIAATSGFGTWPQRTASVARLVPVGHVGRARARMELTSRGWRLDQLRRGIAVGRTWRREIPPPVPWALRNATVAAAATLVPAARNARPCLPPGLPRMLLYPRLLARQRGRTATIMVTAQTIRNAFPRVRAAVKRTPLFSSASLCRRTGCEALFLKMESLQRTGSFKIRGATHKIATLTDDEQSRGVITASAGNHAQGLALAAREAGVPATVFMPETASIAKIAATQGYGANGGVGRARTSTRPSRRPARVRTRPARCGCRPTMTTPLSPARLARPGTLGRPARRGHRSRSHRRRRPVRGRGDGDQGRAAGLSRDRRAGGGRGHRRALVSRRPFAATRSARRDHRRRHRDQSRLRSARSPTSPATPTTP